MSFTPWTIEAATAVLDTTCNQPGPVLISLQALQNEFGYVPKEAVELVAKACNVSRADVHGVLTFYHDLRTSPPPQSSVRICVAEACQSVGSRKLVEDVEKVFGMKMEASTDSVELKPVYCLGNCALGPSAMVNGELIGRATAEGIQSLVKAKS